MVMIRMLVEVVIIIGGYSDNIMVTADVVITIVIEMISGRGYGNGEVMRLMMAMIIEAEVMIVMIIMMMEVMKVMIDSCGCII